MRKRDDTKRKIVNHTEDTCNMAAEAASLKSIQNKPREILRISEQVFINILETVSDMMFIIDSKGYFLFTNKAWREHTGYSPDEVESFNIFDLIHSDDRETAKQSLNRVSKSRLLDDLELKFVTKEGSYIDIEVFLLPIPDSRGNVSAAYGIGRSKTKYRHVMDNLRGSAKKYRNIIDNLPYVIYTANTKGVILSLNKASKAVLNYDPKEIIGRNFKEFVTAEAMSQILKDHDMVISGNRVTSETSFCGKDEEERRLEFVSAPLFKDGKVVETFGVMRDITDIKRSEEQLRRMLEAVTDAVIITDLKGIITQINEKALELYGYNSEDKLLGECIFDLVSTSNQGIDREKIHKAMELGSVRNIEYKILKKDGSEFWGESNVDRLKDNFGKPVGYISMTRNISERKQSEDMLRRSQEKLQSIIMAMPDGLFHINRTGNFLAEPMGYKSTPYTYQNKFIGKNLRDILPGEFAGKLLNTIGIALDRGVRQVIEYQLTVPPGNKAIFEIRIVPYGENEVIAVVRDITERIQSDERLHAYQQQLQSLSSQLSQAEERERRRLATDLHDLIGQPLAVIKMEMDAWADILYSTGHAGNLRQVLELLESAIQNTRSLTYDLSSPILYELGLEAGLESLLEQFKRRHSLHYEFNDDGRDKPLEDEVSTLIYRCVSELLMNIVKHAKAHLVQLGICRDDNGISIIVEDDGIGFSTPDSEGGLHKFGLFSIQERLKGINGSFIIQSEPGYGTRAALHVPLKQT